MDPAVREHLQLDSTLEPEFKIQVMPYRSILTELQAVGAGLSPKEKVWLSDKASYALTEAIPKVCGSCKGKRLFYSLFSVIRNGVNEGNWPQLPLCKECCRLEQKASSHTEVLRDCLILGLLLMELPFQLTKPIYPKNCQLKIRQVQWERGGRVGWTRVSVPVAGASAFCGPAVWGGNRNWSRQVGLDFWEEALGLVWVSEGSSLFIFKPLK